MSRRKRALPDEEEIPSEPKKEVNSRFNQSSRSAKKQKGPQKQKQSGEEFSAKKGKGDILKVGKVQPYAYLPLNRTLLNKRKQKKASTQFTNIVNAAKKGAQKGSKRGGGKRQPLKGKW